MFHVVCRRNKCFFQNKRARNSCSATSSSSLENIGFKQFDELLTRIHVQSLYHKFDNLCDLKLHLENAACRVNPKIHTFFLPHRSLQSRFPFSLWRCQCCHDQSSLSHRMSHNLPACVYGYRRSGSSISSGELMKQQQVH